jgi:ABC-2 type transport system permease protein
LLLGLYAVIQGARAIRGAEESGVMELWLAAGRRRSLIVRDRALAFLGALVVIAVGLGAGTAVGMAAAGEPALTASLVVAGEIALTAAVFYGLALVVSQVLGSSGAAAAASACAMVVLYVISNLWDRLGPLDVLRFVSPFFYRQRSDVLIPGNTFDPVATTVLALVAIAAVPLAGLLFERRDYAAPLWLRRAPARPARRAVRDRVWLRTIWTASIAEHAAGLAAWMAAAAIFMAVYAMLTPAAIEIWERTEIVRVLLVSGSGSATSQFLAFAVGTTAPLIAAFVVAQVAGWVSDGTQRRTDILLSCPVSRTRLVLERATALAAGSAAVVLAALIGLAVGGRLAGVTLDAEGVARTAAHALLLGLAVGGVGALLLASAPHRVVVALLVGWLLTSYLLMLFAPLFGWPQSLADLSVFAAFGDPYLSPPPLSGTLLLTALALSGGLLAIAIAERRRTV